MLSSHHIVVRHAKKVVDHVKKHQHTYLFFGGLAGGIFLVTKIIMLFATSYMFYNVAHDVSFADDFVLTGEVETGTIEEEPVVETGTIEEEPVVETGTVEEEPVVETGTIEEESVVETGTVEEEPVVETGTVEEESVVETGTVEEEYGFESEETCNYLGFSSNIISGTIYTGIMDISWTISSACENEIIDIQLYDHNEEWITLASVSGSITSYEFDTNFLGSGFYTQTGINSSGENIVIYTGIYSGISMSSWTGYRMRWLIQPDTILSETLDFVIDNKVPTVSNIALSYSGSLSGMIGIGKNVVLEFDASELLTGINVVVGSGQTVLSSLSGLHYSYRYVLPTTLPSGYIPYIISYKDFAGFTGSITGTSQLFYDSISPQITGFNLSGYNFSFITSELSRATAFLLFKNTTNGWSFSMTGDSTGHMFSLPTLSLNTDYDMGIVVQDLAGNESKAALSLNRNNSGNISFTLLATLYGQTLTTYSSGVNFLSTTGSIQTGVQEESILEDFKDEIDKYTECKNNIEYTKIKLQIKGIEIVLNMPTFHKGEIKKLVNGFILYILKSLEKAPLSELELQEVANNFDNFSVILKLLKDDNNVCKQTLSNYHLEQFKQSLETYGIDLL